MNDFSVPLILALVTAGVGCAKVLPGLPALSAAPICQEPVAGPPADMCGWVNATDLIVYGQIKEITAVRNPIRHIATGELVESCPVEDIFPAIQIRLAPTRIFTGQVLGEASDVLVVLGEAVQSMWQPRPFVQLPLSPLGPDTVQWSTTGAPLVVGQEIGFGLFLDERTGNLTPLLSPPFLEDADGLRFGDQGDLCEPLLPGRTPGTLDALGETIDACSRSSDVRARVRDDLAFGYFSGLGEVSSAGCNLPHPASNPDDGDPVEGAGVESP